MWVIGWHEPQNKTLFLKKKKSKDCLTTTWGWRGAQLLSGTRHSAIPAGKASESLRLHSLVSLANLFAEFRTVKDPACLTIWECLRYNAELYSASTSADTGRSAPAYRYLNVRTLIPRWREQGMLVYIYNFSARSLREKNLNLRLACNIGQEIRGREG